MAACEAESGLMNLRTGPKFKELKAAIAADPVLKERAVAMLAAMDERVLMRDHVSRWQKRILEHALPGGSA